MALDPDSSCMFLSPLWLEGTCQTILAFEMRRGF